MYVFFSQSKDFLYEFFILNLLIYFEETQSNFSIDSLHK